MGGGGIYVTLIFSTLSFNFFSSLQLLVKMYDKAQSYIMILCLFVLMWQNLSKWCFDLLHFIIVLDLTIHSKSAK